MSKNKCLRSKSFPSDGTYISCSSNRTSLVPSKYNLGDSILPADTVAEKTVRQETELMMLMAMKSASPNCKKSRNREALD